MTNLIVNLFFLSLYGLNFFYIRRVFKSYLIRMQNLTNKVPNPSFTTETPIENALPLTQVMVFIETDAKAKRSAVRDILIEVSEHICSGKKTELIQKEDYRWSLVHRKVTGDSLFYKKTGFDVKAGTFFREFGWLGQPANKIIVAIIFEYEGEVSEEILQNYISNGLERTARKIEIGANEGKQCSHNTAYAFRVRYTDHV